MTDKYKYFRFITYTIEILAFFIVQQTPGLIPNILGERPMLLLPILVTIAIFEGEMAGLFFGLIIGILSDVGLWDIIGFYAIIFMVMGYFISILATNFFKANLITALIVASITILISYLLYYIFAYVLKFYDAAGYAFVRHFLLRMLYTLMVTPVFYFFNKAIALQLRRKDA